MLSRRAPAAARCCRSRIWVLGRPSARRRRGCSSAQLTCSQRGGARAWGAAQPAPGRRRSSSWPGGYAAGQGKPGEWHAGQQKAEECTEWRRRRLRWPFETRRGDGAPPAAAATLCAAVPLAQGAARPLTSIFFLADPPAGFVFPCFTRCWAMSSSKLRPSFFSTIWSASIVPEEMAEMASGD